ncbi:MAG: hypothetical protein GXP45_04775 [bacterium]|nr:hypothetical protein [bacterium]
MADYVASLEQANKDAKDAFNAGIQSTLTDADPSNPTSAIPGMENLLESA